MSDEPAKPIPAETPSAAQPETNGRGGQQPNGQRPNGQRPNGQRPNGRRPDRRRFQPRGGQPGRQNQPPAETGADPAAGEQPLPRGQQGSRNAPRSRKERVLPDRDRGPRRGDQPAPAGQKEAPAGSPAANEDGRPVSAPRPDGQRRGRRNGAQNQRGGQNRAQEQNQNQPRGGNGRQPGDKQRRNGDNRPQSGENRPQNGENRPQNGETRRQGGGDQRQGGDNQRPSAGQPNRRQRGGQSPADGSGEGSQGRRYTVRGENVRSARGGTTGARVKSPRSKQGKPAGARPGEGSLDYIKPPPIKTSVGIKSRNQEGQFALSWWAARWIAAMENLVDGRRLGRGRSYARDGQVLSIEEKPGGVSAQVQGSRVKPYRVAIEVIPLADFEWEKVFDVLASQALFAAQLLAGEMPRNIEEAFESAGTSLFPARLGDLHTDCSCPDWANPCKHVAATHYILAERFDDDPFLLFRLRGRTSEQILSALRERRSGSGEERLPEEPPAEEIVPSLPLPADVDRFYRQGRTLDDFALSFKEPAVEMAALKRLGDPNFLGAESLLATLEPVYRAVRAAALEAALGDAGAEEEESANSGGNGNGK